jgi:hypothetical protein
VASLPPLLDLSEEEEREANRIGRQLSLGFLRFGERRDHCGFVGAFLEFEMGSAADARFEMGSAAASVLLI